MSEIETLSLLFDSAWYLATYQDVAAVNCDPLDHYLSFGYKEGRNPNRFFNTNFYLTTYPDVESCHLNPFIHYILYGASEGRLPRPPHTSPLPVITFDIFSQDEIEKTFGDKNLENTEKTLEESIGEDEPKTIESVHENEIIPPGKIIKKARKTTPQRKKTTLAQKRKNITKS